MTAQVLQEWYGILMDGSPMKKHPIINPYGWYEDFRLVTANMLFFEGSIPLHAWTRRFKRFIRAMKKTGMPWGFKDPRIIPLLGYALSFFDKPIIIRCYRPKDFVVDSYIKKLGWESEYASIRYDRDENLLDKYLKNYTHFRFNFYEHISEMEIINYLDNMEFVKYADS